MIVLLVLPYLAEDALDIFAIRSDGNSLAQVARCRLFAIVSPSVTLRPASYLPGGRYQKVDAPPCGPHRRARRLPWLVCWRAPDHVLKPWGVILSLLVVIVVLRIVLRALRPVYPAGCWAGAETEMANKDPRGFFRLKLWQGELSSSEERQ